MSETVNMKPISILDRAINFISNLFVQESDPEFTLNIPDNILHRTELICNYISTEKGYDFDVDNFLMLLYLDFIKNSIKNYNPAKVFKELTIDYYQDQYIDMSDGETTYRIPRVKHNKTNLTLTMAEDDVIKGQLILDELYDLYHYRIPFSKLLENLWIGFIEAYKIGENKKAYHNIVKLLKECLD